MRKAKKVSPTTEEDVESMDLKFLGHDCHRKFPYKSSLMTHCRLRCKIRPAKGSVAAIRKWDDKGRFHWHLATVSRINNRKQMRVSVKYFDGEQYEPPNVNMEQWGLVRGPCLMALFRTGTAADKIVKQAKLMTHKRSLRS